MWMTFGQFKAHLPDKHHNSLETGRVVTRPKLCLSNGKVIYLDTLSKRGLIYAGKSEEIFYTDSGHIVFKCLDSHNHHADTMYVPEGKTWCLSVNGLNVQVGQSSYLIFQKDNGLGEKPNAMFILDGFATFRFEHYDGEFYVVSNKFHIKPQPGRNDEETVYFNVRDYAWEDNAYAESYSGRLLFYYHGQVCKFGQPSLYLPEQHLVYRVTAAEGRLIKEEKMVDKFPFVHYDVFDVSDMTLGQAIKSFVEFYALKGYRIKGFDPNEKRLYGKLTKEFSAKDICNTLNDMQFYCKLKNDSLLIQTIPWGN